LPVITPDRFAQGRSFDEFVARSEPLGRQFSLTFGEVVIDPATVDRFRAAADRHGGKLKVVVVGADWCPDAQENVPIVAKLAAMCPFIELRIFDRDEDPDVMDHFLSDERRTIPVVAFLDAEHNEIGRWVERPMAAHAFIDQGMREVRRALRGRYREGFRDETLKELTEVVGGLL
jgi:hypothetical protein